jgi:inhibitor of KinA
VSAAFDAPRYTAVGDCGVLVEFATEVSDAANDAVIALDHTIHSAQLTGVTELVPAFVNLLVMFDPLVTDHQLVEAELRSLKPASRDAAEGGRHHVVSVCYEDQFAPDLPAVAAATDLSVEAVINAHLAAEFRVAMYGFAPGYAYMSGTPAAIQVPRKPAPVRGIAADSVIIAGPQCLITTIEMPTGWSVIGRSATQVLRPADSDPFLFDVGDRVSFSRVDLATFDRLVVER